MLPVENHPVCPNRKQIAIPPKHRLLAHSLSLLLIFGCVTLPGVPAMAQDLQTVYQQAASTSPIIARARAQLNANLAGKPLARAALRPHVNAGASGGMNTAHITGFGGQPISTGYHSDVFSVTLTESIFDGQAFTAIKQSDSRVRASEAALAYAQQFVALQVTQAYFGVLEAQANQRVAQQQMDLLKSIDAQTKTSLRVGSGDIISVQEVQAQLDAANADLIRANNAVTVAKNQLERLTHRPTGTLQDVKTLQAIGPQPDTLDPWIAAALNNQPLLRQAQETLKVSEQQVEFAKRARWPTLTLNGVGQHAAGTLIPPFAVNQAGASLNLSIPIYEGGSTRAEIHQAEALSEASRADLANLQDQITLDTQTAFHDLQDSVAQFQATQQAMTSAKVSLDGTRKGYEIGSRSVIDLLTATTNYASAQRNYYLALYTQLVARTQLKAAAGTLTPMDIQVINDLLYSKPSH
ncbi:MAG TPA: TolC family outer membrane protein [Candidatus Dormibacteraeota bacterium]|nr:TolC family outer membrane protein [Candidatus Dormibacteraeota bacterium]